MKKLIYIQKFLDQLRTIFNGSSASLKLIRKTCISKRILLLLVVLLGVLQSILEGLSIYFIYILVSLISNNNEALPNFLINLNNFFSLSTLKAQIIFVLICLIIVQFIQSLTKYFFFIKTEEFSINIKSFIREKIYKRLFNLTYSTSSKITTARLLNLTIDVPEAVRERIEVISNLMVSLMLSISYIFVLTKISLRLLIIVALLQFLVILLQLIPRKYLRLNSQRRNLSEEKINSQLTEEIKSLKYLQSSGIIREPIRRLKKNLLFNIQNTMQLAYIRGILLPSSQFLGIVVLSIITVSSLFTFDSENGLDSGKLVVFIFTLNRLNGKTSQIGENLAVLAVNSGVLNVLDQFLENANKQFRDDKNKKRFQSFRSPEILINNISFKYPENKSSTLENLSMRISPNEFVAIIGETGSGKTTLLDLILKLINPTNGEILVNGDSLSEFNSLDWQKSIGIVNQQSFIYAGSIYENIHLYSGEINKKLLDECLDLVNLKHFVEGLSDKGDTLIGGGARKISGGQMQKINIARALYRKPKILILDEATSNQDIENEIIIRNLITRLKGKLTIITVAHRLNLIVDADNIFLFKNGTIMENGNHVNLLNQRGEYKKLWEKYTSKK